MALPVEFSKLLFQVLFPVLFHGSFREVMPALSWSHFGLICSTSGLLKCSCTFDHKVLVATSPQPMQKCSSRHRLKLLKTRATRALDDWYFLLYITYLDSTVASSIQTSSRAHRYVYLHWLLVQMQVSPLRWSVRSSGIRFLVLFPVQNGVLRKSGISGTRWWLSLENWTPQLMVITTYIACIDGILSEELDGVHF